jgi:hypothetical protein
MPPEVSIVAGSSQSITFGRWDFEKNNVWLDQMTISKDGKDPGETISKYVTLTNSTDAISIDIVVPSDR